MTTKLMSLVMPEGSQELVEAHAAAERGDGYTSQREYARDGALLYPWLLGFFALATFALVATAWNCFIDDPLMVDVYAPWFGVLLVAVTCFPAVFSAGTAWDLIDSVRTYLHLASGAQYPHRRLPEEEELLKDKLTVVAVELSRQVELYESLRAEVEFQGRMAEAGLPADLDIERCRQIAHALHDDLAPKLAQLSVLIQRRNRKAEAKEVDLVALRDTLGGQHRDLIATLKAQQEMDGDPAVQLLHNAVRADAVNAELGDTAAAARELATRRRLKA